MSNHVDLNALLENCGDYEKQIVRLLEGLCLNALDVRSKIVCELSAEEGEWSSGEQLAEDASLYRILMKHAHGLADQHFDEGQWVVFAIMTKLAKQEGHRELLPWEALP